MELSEKSSGRVFGLGLIFSAALLLSACGGSSSRTVNNTTNNSPDPTPAPTAAPDPTPAPDPDPTPAPDPEPSGDAKVTGPMDPVQDEVVTGVVVNQIGNELPAPMDGTVACAASALNYLIDVPDAILAAAEGGAQGSDPFDAFNAAQSDAQISLERFAAQLQSTLAQLTDRGSCDPNAAGSASATNPFAGTPLAAVGDEIIALGGALEDTEGDPNLTSVTATLAPALTALSDAMDAVPAELRSAPVMGATLVAIADALDDVAALMPHVGNYDGDNTAAATATMIDNLMTNILLGVVPMADLDAATGQDFSGQTADGIADLSAALGSGVGEVITPLFEQGLDGALAPLLDPVEGAIALILHPSALNTDSGVWEATSPLVDPLQGALLSVVGDGNVTGSPADALVAMIIGAQGDLTLEQLVVGFGLPNGSSRANLETMVTDANAAQIDAALDDILGFTGGIFNFSLQEALDAVTGDLIDDFLNGLL